MMNIVASSQSQENLRQSQGSVINFLCIQCQQHCNSYQEQITMALSESEIAHWRGFNNWQVVSKQYEITDRNRWNQEYAEWRAKNDAISAKNPLSHTEFQRDYAHLLQSKNGTVPLTENKPAQPDPMLKASQRFDYNMQKLCSVYGYFSEADLRIPFIRAARLIKTTWLQYGQVTENKDEPLFIRSNPNDPNSELVYNTYRAKLSGLRDHPAKDCIFRMITNEDIFFNDTLIAIFRVAKSLRAQNKIVDLCSVHDEYRMQFDVLKKDLPQLTDVDWIADVLTTIEYNYDTLSSEIFVEETVNQHIKWYIAARTSYLDDLKAQLLRQGISLAWLDEHYQKHMQVLKAMTPMKIESFSSQIDEALSMMENRSDGISTDLKDLDHMMKLKNGCLYYIGGRPGMGKTALSLHFLLLSQLLDQRKKVLFFSLEMSKEQLINRLICSVGGINANMLKDKRLSDLDQDTFEQYYLAAKAIKALDITLIDQGVDTITSLQSTCEQVKDRDKNLGLIVVDYLQLLKGSGQNKNQIREQEVSEISRALKLLAKKCDCPVICLTQLNRQVEGRHEKRPSLSDLRESGSLEQDADAVLMLFRADYYDKDASPNLEIIVAKNRHGSLGTATVEFDRETQRISDLPFSQTKW
jgi:replicative DNA helicase